ncbi:helix-turn-helix domain-containing protein [Candidatus Dependentiae bacterium]|nr:helix-turn-helix domain-containing protein [Candidatus Dependentiae bacterium]
MKRRVTEIIMKIAGRFWKDGKFWLVEIPFLDLMVQSKTKKEIPEMVKDAIELLVNDPSFSVKITLSQDNLYVEANDFKKLIALILKRLRLKNGLTIEDVTVRLKEKSVNAYAQYEQAKHSPGFEKLEELLKAVEPSSSINMDLTKR